MNLLPSNTSNTASIVDLDAERMRRKIDDLGHIRPWRREPEPPVVTGMERASSILDGSLEVTRDRVPNEGRQASLNLVTSASTLFSLCIHVVTLVALLWTSPQQGIGIGGAELQGISVEIVTATAFESKATPVAVTYTPAALVAVENPPSVDQAEVMPEVVVNEMQPEPPKAPPQPDDLALLRTEVKEPPVEQQREPEDHKKVDEVQPQLAAQAPQSASIIGGTRSRDGTEAASVEAASGASPGTLSRYAMEIRLALGKFRPRHGGSRGRVLVSFGLDERGDVRIVEIAQSSGLSELDAAARTAVLRAKFPTPPSAMTEQQRTYTVPFEFK